MKIDFITYSAAVNYGAMLQTYGLYSYLKNEGHDVKVINYIQDRYDFDNPDFENRLLSLTRFWKMCSVTRYIWKKTRLNNIKLNSIVFRDFLSKNMELTRPYYSLDELMDDIPTADLYITGSDQVWNSEYTLDKQVDLPFYYSFLPDDCKRISYASSFGKNNISDKEKVVIHPLLSKYSAISVREESAKKILDDMGLKATVVCDPTLLCDFSEYEKLASSSLSKSDPYILLFMIGFDKELYKLAKNFSKLINKELVVILPDHNDKNKCSGRVYVTPTIEKWLELFKYAEYIITNSFHGTVFSILFNKEFTTSMMVQNNGRIINILDKTNLLNRCIKDYSIDGINKQYNEHINYNDVNAMVINIRKESQAWLNKEIG